MRPVLPPDGSRQRPGARLASWTLGRLRLPGPLLPAAVAALLALGLRLPDLLPPSPPPARSAVEAALGSRGRTAPPLPQALEAVEVPADVTGGAWPEPAAGPGDAGPAAEEAETACPTTPAAIADVAMEARRRRDAALRLEKELAAREAAQRAEAARLTALKAELDKRATQARAEDAARVGQLVKVYEAMKPKDAAQVLERLEMPVLLPIALHMREVRLAPILAAMDPMKARAVTVALAAPGGTSP